MPSDYLIDLARGLVISRAWGVLTDDDLLGRARTLAHDPRIRPDMRQLSDFREITELKVHSATIREMVALSPFGTGARRAVIVGSDASYGMARMYQLLQDTTPESVDVYRELEPALAWLELTDAAAEVSAALGSARSIPGSG